MRKIMFMVVLVVLVTVIAVPMGWCTIPGVGIPSDRPMARVNLPGSLTVTPRIMLRVNGTTADAIGECAYDQETMSTMVLGTASSNYPEPGALKTVTSGTYTVDVYSNDEWTFFMYRTPINWSGRKLTDLVTDEPKLEYSKNNGSNWNNFVPLLWNDTRWYQPTTDNDWKKVGDYKFQASFDAGTEPGTYTFDVSFVAYQE